MNNYKVTYCSVENLDKVPSFRHTLSFSTEKDMLNALILASADNRVCSFGIQEMPETEVLRTRVTVDLLVLRETEFTKEHSFAGRERKSYLVLKGLEVNGAKIEIPEGALVLRVNGEPVILPV